MPKPYSWIISNSDEITSRPWRKRSAKKRKAEKSSSSKPCRLKTVAFQTPRAPACVACPPSDPRVVGKQDPICPETICPSSYDDHRGEIFANAQKPTPAHGIRAPCGTIRANRAPFRKEQYVSGCWVDADNVLVRADSRFLFRRTAFGQSTSHMVYGKRYTAIVIRLRGCALRHQLPILQLSC